MWWRVSAKASASSRLVALASTDEKVGAVGKAGSPPAPPTLPVLPRRSREGVVVGEAAPALPPTRGESPGPLLMSAAELGLERGGKSSSLSAASVQSSEASGSRAAKAAAAL